MVGGQGANSSLIKRENRNKILLELIKSPKHFSALKRELSISSATLTDHLKSLVDNGYLEREIKGRKIVYVVARHGKTLGEFRLECRKRLESLLTTYGVCLNLEIQAKLRDVIKDIDSTLRKVE